MVDANVPDIALEPDKTVKKVTFYKSSAIVFCIIYCSVAEVLKLSVMQVLLYRDI